MRAFLVILFLFALFDAIQGSFFVFFNSSNEKILLPDCLFLLFKQPRGVGYHTETFIDDPYTSQLKQVQYYYCDQPIADFKTILNFFLLFANGIHYCDQPTDDGAIDLIENITNLTNDLFDVIPKNCRSLFQKKSVSGFLDDLDVLDRILNYYIPNFTFTDMEIFKKWSTHRFLPAVINGKSVDYQDMVPYSGNSLLDMYKAKVLPTADTKFSSESNIIVVKQERVGQFKNHIKMQNTLCSFDQLCETELYLSLEPSIAKYFHGKRAVLLQITPEHCSIVGYLSTYFNKVTLLDYLATREDFICVQFVTELKKLFIALNQLHQKDIVHRHISSGSIFIARNINGDFYLALGDFLYAKHLSSDSGELKELKLFDWRDLIISTLPLILNDLKKRNVEAFSSLLDKFLSEINIDQYAIDVSLFKLLDKLISHYSKYNRSGVDENGYAIQTSF